MKKKILVVDDSAFILQVMVDMLREFNYEVTALDCAMKACEEVENTQFDMIITDLNMPNMDGIQFARRAKQIPACKFTPIVMVSCEGNEEKIAEAKKMGISTFLSKPVKESHLKGMIQMTIG